MLTNPEDRGPMESPESPEETPEPITLQRIATGVLNNLRAALYPVVIYDTLPNEDKEN